MEERLAGEEFTLQCFVDGETVSPMPAVRDFKRAFEGDRGPNTGGMGSYSQADGLLPFLSQAGYDTALDIVRKVVQAVKEEGAEYKGILYGQFMLTPAGVKLVEFNARLGDPEAINVIPLLQTGLADICAAIMSGSLDKLSIGFDAKAAVCKYVVPPDYGMEPKVGVPIRVDSDKIASLGAQVFYARVNRDGDRLLTTTSRSVAILGLGRIGQPRRDTWSSRRWSTCTETSTYAATSASWQAPLPTPPATADNPPKPQAPPGSCITLPPPGSPGSRASPRTGCRLGSPRTGCRLGSPRTGCRLGSPRTELGHWSPRTGCRLGSPRTELGHWSPRTGCRLGSPRTELGHWSPRTGGRLGSPRTELGPGVTKNGVASDVPVMLLSLVQSAVRYALGALGDACGRLGVGG